VNSTGRPRSAGEIVASHRREDLIDPLLENLSRALTRRRDDTKVQVYLYRRFTDGYEQGLAIWPRTKRANENIEPVDFEVSVVSGLRIFTSAERVAKQQRLIAETITWLAAIMRTVPPRRSLEKARHDALSAQAEVEVFEVRIARARESERIRLVETMTTATLRDLKTVRAMLAPSATTTVRWPSVAEAMGRIIRDFRTTVRGVFPAMLPERGAEETLKELAATLPIAVEFRGELGRRPRWEVESTFTHAVADVLGALASLRLAVQVILERDGALRARVRGGGSSSDVAMLTDTLRANRERLEALGGALTISSSGPAGVQVAVTVPDRNEASWLPLSKRQLNSRPVHARVAMLLESTRLSEEEVAPWRRDLFAPVRLLVLQQPLPTPLPGVQALMCAGDPDLTLAEQLRDPHGPWGRIDAVVCGYYPGAEFVRELRDGPLLFAAGTDAAAAAALLSVRAPVFAARRALAQIHDYVQRHPRAQWLRMQADHLTRSSHELVEDALLNDLARGTAPSVIDDEGARLIGIDGGAPQSRLGLAENASSSAIEDAASVLLDRWMSIADRPELDHRSRRAAEVVRDSAARVSIINNVPKR